MKIEDYIKSLPEKIITGEDVQLSASTLREILEFADIGEKDVFYHLGCGDGAGPAIATEYGARAIGIDADSEKIKKAEKIHTNSNAIYECKKVQDVDILDATAVFFWFADEEIVDAIADKLSHPGNVSWKPKKHRRCIQNIHSSCFFTLYGKSAAFFDFF